MRWGLAVLVFFFVHSAGYPGTIYVPDDHVTIQEAITESMNGDLIIVRPGTYHENIDFSGKTITVRSEQGPEVTVIEGLGSETPDVPVVRFISGESRLAVLDGFSVTGGNTRENIGGGVHCLGSSPTIMNNIVRENICTVNFDSIPVQGHGGGIYCEQASSALIINNRILNNSADIGGGLCDREGSSSEFRNNIILGNKAIGDGGGISVNRECNSVIDGNIIIGNIVESLFPSYPTTRGGGIRLSRTSATVVNNIISHNKSVNGGGIDIRNADPALYDINIVNNTVCYNISTRFNSDVAANGAGINIRENSHPVVVNTIFWANEAEDNGNQIYLGYGGDPKTPGNLTISYSVVMGGNERPDVYVTNGDPPCELNWGAGMGSDDPCLMDPDNPVLENRDFHIEYGSPCKDSGDADAVPAGIGNDFEGDPRKAFGKVDIGADEYFLRLYLGMTITPGGKIKVEVISYKGDSVIIVVDRINVVDRNARDRPGAPRVLKILIIPTERRDPPARPHRGVRVRNRDRRTTAVS